MLWLYLLAADLILGVVLAWMILSGWWVNGSSRCWDRMQKKFEKEK